MSKEIKHGNVLIESDGTSLGTHVFCGGVEMRNIQSIEIEKMTIGCVVTANITVLAPTLQIIAEPDGLQDIII